MLPLGAYLLKPVQRVLKYSLLLRVSTWSFRFIETIVTIIILYSVKEWGTNNHAPLNLHLKSSILCVDILVVTVYMFISVFGDIVVSSTLGHVEAY